MRPHSFSEPQGLSDVDPPQEPEKKKSKKGDGKVDSFRVWVVSPKQAYIEWHLARKRRARTRRRAIGFVDY